jgi:hypothetical protein
MNLVLLAATLCSLSLAIAQQSVEEAFDADTHEVSPGQPAHLTWKSSTATEAYLSSYGLLSNPRSGSLEEKPTETTDYVLILEAPGVPPQVLSHQTAKKLRF